MRAAALGLIGILTLAGCGGPAEPTWAPEAAVQRWSFKNAGPATVTLFTVINNTNGAGRHSGLMINGDERVMFDPAGSFRHPDAPERNDVHYGISDRVLAVYVDYHARETFDVHIQELQVSPEVAQGLIRAVESYGAVPKAQCSLAIGRVLSGAPGFESMPKGYSPNRLSRDFAALPGAGFRVVTDDDADDNHGVLLVAARDAQARTARSE